MARQETHVVPERKEVLADGADQGIVIPARQIGTADRTLEEHVTHDRKAPRFVEIRDMPGRMPGAVTHCEPDVADRDLVVLLQPAVRLETPGRLESEHPGLRGQSLDQRTVAQVRALDGDATTPRELSGTGGVVDVGMRQQDFLELETFLGHHSEYVVEITAGVDDSGTARRLAPEHGTVLLEGRDGDYSKLHRSTCGWLSRIMRKV